MKMLQKEDLDRALRIWGSIRTPISKESIELWGRIDPGAVINVYRMLTKGLVVTEPKALEHKNRKNERAKPSDRT
jgi:hypothetical protein